MKKFTMYAGIQILVLLCIFLGCQGLTLENAWAAEDPPVQQGRQCSREPLCQAIR